MGRPLRATLCLVRSPIDQRARCELTQFGDAIGDPSRAAMLVALMGGVARPAGELARAAGVSPSTATSHLNHLTTAGLIEVRVQGRFRYYALCGSRVADAVERVVALGMPSATRCPRTAEPSAVDPLVT